MSNIQIFGSHGEFIGLSDEAYAALDNSKRERYVDLKLAHELVQKSEAGLVTLQGLQEQAANHLRECRAALLKLRPKMTVTDLAKDMIRQRRAGLIA